MDRKQLDRVEQLFQLLEGSPREVQKSELARLAADDEKVHAKVAALLNAASESRHRAEPKLVAELRQGAAAKLTELCEEFPAGTRFGDYVIMESLAEGGFGRVYKAAERNDISRIVALKVVKAGFDTREVLARFRIERQVLANMNHRNIAKLFRAGSTEVGRPYFVMEYVPGVPITKFADQNQLSISDRLGLFQQVCEAISHAHQKAVIHRDIKASNILAYLADGKPVVKVIDFGIAKVLTGDRLAQHSIANTGRDSVIGSFESMSPEQAQGRPDIDTLTDVYSLGVVLYELLVGANPFDTKILERSGDAEARRMIREVQPPRPSTRLTALGDMATDVAAARKMRIDSLAKALSSELEWIPLMAMRKERERRYRNPLALSQDIHNYLNQLPLEAGPERITYHAAKFVRRNAAMVVLTTIAAILLIAATIGSIVWSVHERTLRQRAETAENKVNGMLAESEKKRLKAVEYNRLLAQSLHNEVYLHRLVPQLNFRQNGLSDVLEFLKEITGAPLAINQRAFARAGIKDAPITLSVTNATLEQVLVAIERQPSVRGRFGFVVNDQGVLVITDKRIVERIIVTRSYDVAIIADKPLEIESMVHDIRSRIGTDSAEVEQHEGTLWVRATVLSQTKIDELLSLVPKNRGPRRNF